VDTLEISARGISVAIDLSVGHISDFAVEAAGKMLRPLHRAPWIDEPNLPEGIAEGLARLSGDFLCAPFSKNDVEEAPGHGWPGNSRWSVASTAASADGWEAVLRLDRKVMGAVVEKRLKLRDGHPFLYQEHRFIGGRGELPAAHHVMAVMSNGGRMAFSPKRLALTPDTPLEPDPSRGRYMLAYPARSEDLSRFPLRGDGVTDIHLYRAEDRREDFIMLAEAAGDGPGWTALARDAEQDLLLVLKNPAELPITMLWYSNGGRDYAPWNGRHIGVLGIEDGRTAVGHSESIGDNALKREGVATSFTLVEDGEVRFRHVIGALPNPQGEVPLAVTPDHDRLRLGFAGNVAVHLPYDGAFLLGA